MFVIFALSLMIAFVWSSDILDSVTSSTLPISFAAVPNWLVEGVELDFQEFARRPFGGPFGAIGVNAAYGSRRQDLFIEVTRSFDSQAGGGGGYGAIAKSVTTLNRG